MLVPFAAFCFSLPTTADPASKPVGSGKLIAQRNDDDTTLPPPPQLKKKDADEKSARFQPEPVDDGAPPSGDDRREGMMRRRAIRQRMMQRYAQQFPGRNFQGSPDDGPNGSAVPGGMRPGFGSDGSEGPNGFGRGFRGGAQGYPSDEGMRPEMGGENGMPPGEAGGMRGMRGRRSMRAFGPDGYPPGFGSDGGPPQMRGYPGGPQSFGMNGAEFGRGRRRMEGGLGGGHPLDLTPLALSDQQKSKIQAMREQSKLKLKDLKKGLSEKQSNLRNLMFSPDASEAQIRAARREMRGLQDQMDETNLNDLLSIRGMLTPEQKKKLPECMPGRREARGPAGPPKTAFDPGAEGNVGDARFVARTGARSKSSSDGSANSSTGMYKRHPRD